MFNLGYKQIVINSDAVVVETNADGTAVTTPGTTGNLINIEGFGKFAIGSSPAASSIDATAGAAVAPAVGVVTPALPTFASAVAVGDVIDVVVKFAEAPRLLSEAFPYGEKIAMQSVVTTSANTAGFLLGLAATIKANFNDILAVSGSTLVFKAGYEGLNVKSIEVTDEDGESGFMALTVGTVGTEGAGNGKQIEAEVRNATFDNLDPYGVQFGGNSMPDVRATYTMVKWVAQPDLNGWGAHEMLGYGDANTKAAYAPVEFVAYCNDVSATGAVALIDAIIA
ncbi:MAG: hypothetical protein KAH32_03115 [Chlamydiia bacterium]|nr:hypothetical protein [Chlamydiia bacterium]